MHIRELDFHFHTFCLIELVAGERSTTLAEIPPTLTLRLNKEDAQRAPIWGMRCQCDLLSRDVNRIRNWLASWRRECSIAPDSTHVRGHEAATSRSSPCRTRSGAVALSNGAVLGSPNLAVDRSPPLPEATRGPISHVRGRQTCFCNSIRLPSTCQQVSPLAFEPAYESKMSSSPPLKSPSLSGQCHCCVRMVGARWKRSEDHCLPTRFSFSCKLICFPRASVVDSLSRDSRGTPEAA
jgi:hypothetical protein